MEKTFPIWDDDTQCVKEQSFIESWSELKEKRERDDVLPFGWRDMFVNDEELREKGNDCETGELSLKEK
jgi:hypothetical protein